MTKSGKPDLVRPGRHRKCAFLSGQTTTENQSAGTILEFRFSLREETMSTKRNRLVSKALLLGGIAVAAWPVLAAEVTSERLINADKEPQNWLMNHRTYDGQRFSPLDQINKSSVKNLKLAYAVALGGTSADENLEATPLVEDGFMYMVDLWGIVYKIDVRSGDAGRIGWRLNPKQEKVANANRGVALWGNYVISGASYPPRIIASDKDSGKVVWETNVSTDQAEVQITAAPLAIKDKIIVGAAGGDRGVRDFMAALDAASGKLLWRKFTIPAPGEPGSETWKSNAWQTGGAAVWVTGTYDAETDQTIWGTGNPVPQMDPRVRPGDNLYTNSAISWDPASGRMNWYMQYTPGDMWDFDEVGTHILIDRDVDGQPRKLITHSGRNGFVYTMDRHNGQMVMAKPYVQNVNWTKGIDQKTGKPVDYDPGKDIQTYSGLANPTPGGPIKKVCPNRTGGNNYFPSSYSQRTKLLYIPALTACEDVSLDQDLAKTAKDKGWFARSGGAFKTDERYESDLTAVDPTTGEIKKTLHLPYPNYSG